MTKTNSMTIRPTARTATTLPGRERPASRSPWIDPAAAYIPRPPDARASLYLDANEGRPLPAALERLRSASPTDLCRYPSTGRLEAELARRWDVDARRVVVCAGADDALSRVCAIRLAPGARLLAFAPAFAMVRQWARTRGAQDSYLSWPENSAFPLAAALDLAERCPSLGLALVASPANPTGEAPDTADVYALADACRSSGTAFVLDAAYAEFEDEDASAGLVQDGSAFVARTFSKAYGLAGLRVGYVIAPDARDAAALRAAGSPYPCSGLALDLALASLADDAGLAAAVDRVRLERSALRSALLSRGARVSASQANFVFARLADAAGFSAALADCGVAVRAFGSTPGLADAVRIGCPCDTLAFDRLMGAIESAGSYI